MVSSSHLPVAASRTSGLFRLSSATTAWAFAIIGKILTVTGWRQSRQQERSSRNRIALHTRQATARIFETLSVAAESVEEGSSAPNALSNPRRESLQILVSIKMEYQTESMRRQSSRSVKTALRSCTGLDIQNSRNTPSLPLGPLVVIYFRFV